MATLGELEKALEEQLTAWQQMQAQDIPVLNKALQQAKLPVITVSSPDSKESGASPGMHTHHEDLE